MDFNGDGWQTSAGMGPTPLQQILHLPLCLHARFNIQEHCESFPFNGVLDNWLGSNVDPAYSTPLRKRFLHILLRQMFHQSFSSALLMSHKQMHDSLY